MSRIFEALQHANPELSRAGESGHEIPQEFSTLVGAGSDSSASLEEAKMFRLFGSASARLVAWTEPNCLASENFRVLSSRLRQARQRRPIRLVLVTSAVRGDGKSVVSANLAIALAAHGEKTLLLEGDLHRPSLAGTFSLDGSRGFATCHQEPTALPTLLHRCEGLPLWFLAAGDCEQQPLTLIQSARTSELIQQLAGIFTWIVVDSPPLVPLADSGIWATMCDAVVLVAREGTTPRVALHEAAQSIGSSKLFALVMNDADPKSQDYYNAYYHSNTDKKKVAARSRG